MGHKALISALMGGLLLLATTPLSAQITVEEKPTVLRVESNGCDFKKITEALDLKVEKRVGSDWHYYDVDSGRLGAPRKITVTNCVLSWKERNELSLPEAGYVGIDYVFRFSEFGYEIYMGYSKEEYRQTLPLTVRVILNWSGLDRDTTERLYHTKGPISVEGGFYIRARTSGGGLAREPGQIWVVELEIEPESINGRPIPLNPY